MAGHFRPARSCFMSANYRLFREAAGDGLPLSRETVRRPAEVRAIRARRRSSNACSGIEGANRMDGKGNLGSETGRCLWNGRGLRGGRDRLPGRAGRRHRVLQRALGAAGIPSRSGLRGFAVLGPRRRLYVHGDRSRLEHGPAAGGGGLLPPARSCEARQRACFFRALRRLPAVPRSPGQRGHRRIHRGRRPHLVPPKRDARRGRAPGRREG